MPIPEFRADGWLPVGHHATTWEEIVTTFGGVDRSRRTRLTQKLLELRDNLRAQAIGGTLVRREFRDLLADV